MVDSGTSMHMLSKKDLSSAELDTLGKSRNPTTVITADGEVHTSEEAQLHVDDLELFVTSAIRALPDLRKGHRTKPSTKKDAPADQHGTWRKKSTSSKKTDKATFTFLLTREQCRRPLQSLQREENSWLTPEHQCIC